jgi:hypothetical protein
MTQKLIEFESDPNSLFIFAINSTLTKAKYVARLNKFLDFIKLTGTPQEKCITFAQKSKSGPPWALGCVMSSFK